VPHLKESGAHACGNPPQSEQDCTGVILGTILSEESSPDPVAKLAELGMENQDQNRAKIVARQIRTSSRIIVSGPMVTTGPVAGT